MLPDQPYSTTTHPWWRARRARPGRVGLIRRATLGGASVVAAAALVSACGGGSATHATSGKAPAATAPSPDSSPGSGNGAPTPAATSAASSVVVTVPAGYQYQVSAGPVTTATTEGESGLSPQDAPPGTQFLQATLTVKNATDRQEPLDNLATTDGSAGNQQVGAVLAIPMVNVASFGASCAAVSSSGKDTGAGLTAPYVPPGYCLLGTAVSSISGPASDGIGPVEMSPGDTETVVIYAGQPVDQGSLPLDDVAVFAGDQPPVQLLRGPSSPATLTPAGVPVLVGSNEDEALSISRSAIGTAPDPNNAGRVQLVTKLTITNPTSKPVNISNLATPTSIVAGVVAFVVPAADQAALGDPITDCGTMSGAPSDNTCIFFAYLPSTTNTTIPAGQSVETQIGTSSPDFYGLAATAPVQDFKLYYIDNVQTTEIPQSGG